MKQSEFNKHLNGFLKEEAKNIGWKFSRGFLFKKEGGLFLTIIFTGLPKDRKLSWVLSFKHYEIDDVFWDIVKLPENRAEPLSFRACGAWVAPSMEIQSKSIVLPALSEVSIHENVKEVLAELNLLSRKVASSVTSYQSYLHVLEGYYSQLIAKHPNAIRTIWVESLLTSLLESQYDVAKSIATSRIEAGDSGGFNYAGSTFYQLANEYIEQVQST
jgi:hypothetical protein